ncbi:hypothetical protein DMH04_53490 [Kibdelosporangium aridum]|uniref:Peptidase S33 tripeptidyl aminopeptidase-like C-terminal domain-containing protein n=1 Tax=Kibdelosporangium aridum TaxID=2030 RepID=A0A428Y2V9_KIBAR|nr:alpha/beta hydrolase [Kibdelosporangium aridum]RSM61923.1 hypothetical protein DMH04_53490 [Kibdelosporangium aridum]
MAGIAEVKAGKGDALLKLRDTFVQRDADGRYGGFLEALMAINCVDEDRHPRERETELRKTVARVAPIFDTGTVTESVSPCAKWPGTSTLGFPYADKIDPKILADTLVVSVTGDPATPHEGGVAMAKQLQGGLLTVEGKQHGAVFVAGNACVDGLVADYLVDLKLPSAGATCEL